MDRMIYSVHSRVRLVDLTKLIMTRAERTLEPADTGGKTPVPEEIAWGSILPDSLQLSQKCSLPLTHVVQRTTPFQEKRQFCLPACEEMHLLSRPLQTHTTCELDDERFRI